MEFTGRVKKLLPVRSGTSQRTGNEWRALPFIFEYHEHETDRYADEVLLETFDERVIDNLEEGMEVICGFGHRTREYDGKIYNDIRLYKIESVRKAQKAAQQQAPATVQVQTTQPAATAEAQAQGSASNQGDAPNQDEDEDLPF
jgi:GTP cyclohydrolase III